MIGHCEDLKEDQEDNIVLWEKCAWSLQEKFLAVASECFGFFARTQPRSLKDGDANLFVVFAPLFWEKSWVKKTVNQLRTQNCWNTIHYANHSPLLIGETHEGFVLHFAVHFLLHQKIVHCHLGKDGNNIWKSGLECERNQGGMEREGKLETGGLHSKENDNLQA